MLNFSCLKMSRVKEAILRRSRSQRSNVAELISGRYALANLREILGSFESADGISGISLSSLRESAADSPNISALDSGGYPLKRSATQAYLQGKTCRARAPFGASRSLRPGRVLQEILN